MAILIIGIRQPTSGRGVAAIVLPARIEDRAMPAPDVVLIHLLPSDGESGGGIDGVIIAEVPRLVLVAGVFHQPDVVCADIAEVLQGDACVKAPRAALADGALGAADVRALAIATIFIVAAAALKKLTGCDIAETGMFGKSIERAADGIRAVGDAALAFDQLHVIDGKGIDRVPVLHGACAPGRIIQADAIDQQQIAAARLTADEWRAVAEGGFLRKHAWGVAEGIGEIAAEIFREEMLIERVAGVSGIGAIRFRAASGDDDGLQEILAASQRSEGDG